MKTKSKQSTGDKGARSGQGAGSGRARGKPGAFKSKAGEKVLVTLLLDRSSSMHEIREQTIAGVNDWLAGLRRSTGDIRLSLVLFDTFDGKSALEKVFVARPIAEVKDLEWNDFVPRGGTPLIDAAWDTIQAVRDSLSGRDAKAVIAIQTDGDENASRHHTWHQLQGLIKECEAQGYQFQFIGAGINAYQQGARMGLSADKIMSYGNNRAETRAAFAATAANTVAFADGASLNVSYSGAQKSAAGDRYAGGVGSPVAVDLSDWGLRKPAHPAPVHPAPMHPDLSGCGIAGWGDNAALPIAPPPLRSGGFIGMGGPAIGSPGLGGYRLHIGTPDLARGVRSGDAGGADVANWAGLRIGTPPPVRNGSAGTAHD